MLEEDQSEMPLFKPKTSSSNKHLIMKVEVREGFLEMIIRNLLQRVKKA